jgi:phosphoglucosamine mutase
MDTKELRRAVSRGGFDIGFAFDGDADRCLAIDERGALIDGDTLLAVIARDMKQNGKLKNNAVVGTIISNSGLDEFGRREGIDVMRSDVGDRNVMELMKKSGACLGGETSGHMIFLDDATTGDGQLTALKFLNLLARSGRKASELAADVPKYPQIAINVPVSWGAKTRIMGDPTLMAAIETERTKIGTAGSVLVRPSGTEALIRVTVEAQTEALAVECANLLAGIVKKL